LVSNWKRLQDSNGKFKAFGFCDFASPEGARNALRVLKNYPLGDKRLNLKVLLLKFNLILFCSAKVDEETEKNLEEFAKNKLKAAAVNGQNVQTVAAEVNDELLKKGIRKIIEDQAPELLELAPPPEEGLHLQFLCLLLNYLEQSITSNHQWRFQGTGVVAVVRTLSLGKWHHTTGCRRMGREKFFFCENTLKTKNNVSRSWVAHPPLPLGKILESPLIITPN